MKHITNNIKVRTQDDERLQIMSDFNARYGDAIIFYLQHHCSGISFDDIESMTKNPIELVEKLKERACQYEDQSVAMEGLITTYRSYADAAKQFIDKLIEANHEEWVAKLPDKTTPETKKRKL